MTQPSLSRRTLLAAAAATAAGIALHPGQAGESGGFALEEVPLADLQTGLASGKWTSRRLAELYLARIAAVDRAGPELRSVIETNPEALALADALDLERRTKGPRGPLHGIPILVKDNIDTADRMATTAGSLALLGAKPPSDAFLVQRLRAAGALLLGKANLSEWANIRSNRSSSGWSGRGGQTKNPYALDRNPSGSSSGSGAAASASLCAAAVGTETDGSIVSPASNCGVVGLKPTVGLVSRTGVIPISHTQDTAGPMARSVRDAAMLLGGLVGMDPEDAATKASDGKSHADYTKFLDADGLKGARIGVVRRMFGFNKKVEALMAESLTALKDAGAELIDVEFKSANQIGGAELTILLTELKADLNAYLKRLGPDAPVKSLEEIIAFNKENAELEMPHFGQELFVRAQCLGGLDSAEYLAAVEKCRKLSRDEGIDAAAAEHKVEAFIAPTNGPAWTTNHKTGDRYSGGGASRLPAVAGYPHLTVPAGFVGGLPIGLSFFGPAWSEPTLLKLGYAFEQKTKARKAPQFLASVSPAP